MYKQMIFIHLHLYKNREYSRYMLATFLIMAFPANPIEYLIYSP